MRRDFKIALIIGVAAFPAGLAVSEALEYFRALKEHPGIGFFASSTVTLILLVWAAILAVRGEREAERGGAKRRMIPLIGMICSTISLLGFSAWYFWPASVNGSIVSTAQTNDIGAPKAEAPLPSDAKFQYKGKIFWGIPRKFSRDDATDF